MKKAPAFMKGGKGKMAGKQSAGPQKPGTSNPAMGSGGGKFAKGGKTKMAGKQTVSPAKAR